ncbi:hypothetical protein SPRG_08552 [Saprolegnia parasitica CBS 223.65]|uniref:Uncharacterized protein n=1 Tax=Saprolegnia parasitica (strain CBS 223.65) TaxID=695850 RepID=A0A067CAM6_SAPPC|nr:hypothetical protein SPRG_08552 [Saprolegnia parasitica CBS 223.65]KDO26190.1 hypothetical protein SPRG_08552 [Saprolegnia parasitica CBS 223.65]|eukprot:XP_012203183.1 hypothetical protein SPRG_08552 [Saprolegnia parasitica CBS 223.65]
MMLCHLNEMPRYTIAFQEPTAAKFSSRYADYHEECITEYYRQECLLAFYRLQNVNTERPRKKRKRRCVTFADAPEIVGVADAAVDREPVPTARISRDEMKQLLDERVFPSSAKRPRTMLYH